MIETFRPLLEAASGIDLAQPELARAELARRFDPKSAAAGRLRDELLRLFEERKIANRGEPPVFYGRVAKATPETLGFSIDVVVMTGAGPRHRHPRGEINYCVPLEGTPAFEKTREGWVVMTPESAHVPAVDGGRMLIVYLLPA